MSQINKVRIPVQMGSKKIQVNYEYTFNNYSLNVEQLMKIVLKKVYPNSDQNDDLIKSYRVYENAFGIERIVKNNENILNLFTNQTELKSNVYFVVRKKSLKHKTSSKKILSSRKCFEKLKIHKDISTKLKVVDDVEKKNINNLLTDDSWNKTIKNAFINQIEENEIILNKQIHRMDNLDKKIQLREKKSKNNNIFQSIYSKLIDNKKAKRNNFNQSSMFLIDSAGECSSNSSSRNSSSSKLDTLF